MHRVFRFPLQFVLDHFVNPYERDNWGLGLLCIHAVRKAVEENRLDARPNTLAWPGRGKREMLISPHYDTERVAYLIKNRDTTTPIEIYVWPCGVKYHFVDGAHRTSAAVYCGDESILVTFKGCETSFEKLFQHVYEEV